MRQQQGDAEAHQADEELEVSVRTDQGLRSSDISTVGPRSDHVAADAESQHEHRCDDRSRIDRIPKHVSELAHPYDLIDQSAEARKKEQQIEDCRGEYHSAKVCRLENYMGFPLPFGFPRGKGVYRPMSKQRGCRPVGASTGRWSLNPFEFRGWPARRRARGKQLLPEWIEFLRRICRACRCDEVD